VVLCPGRFWVAEEQTVMEADDLRASVAMATGVGERAEAAEGLYLGCRPRYSRRKRGCQWSSWSMMGQKNYK
jgi:hypothetical protein